MIRLFAAGAVAFSLTMVGCASDPASESTNGEPTIVVTTSVLGSLVREVVGDAAEVVTLIPDGADPHDWSPSAKDIEAMSQATVVVDNGLDLEANLRAPLESAAADGASIFTVADHVTVRETQSGQADPHVWMDPLTMREWIAPFATLLGERGIDVRANAIAVEDGLTAWSGEVDAIVNAIPADRRKLVTGHDSMGYFAARYGFEVVGAINPSLTSQAEPSAADLAALSEQVRTVGVPAIFAELGTPAAVASAIAADTGAVVVELSTHQLPADGTYRSFILGIATTIADALR